MHLPPRFNTISRSRETAPLWTAQQPSQPELTSQRMAALTLGGALLTNVYAFLESELNERIRLR
jgi:hypothetical protein